VRGVAEQEDVKGIWINIELLLRYKYGDLILLLSVMLLFGLLIAFSAS
jgi:hypothetical protein